MTIALISLFSLMVGIACFVAWRKGLLVINTSVLKNVGEHASAESETNIYEFNDKHISDIVIHRIDMCVLEVDLSYKEVMDVIINRPYNRYPVFEEDIDQIVGIIHVKDILSYLHNHNDTTKFQLRNIMHDPFFILESQRVDLAFKDMQKEQIALAVVLDEYGGTEGLITTEDMVKEMVTDVLQEDDSYVLNKPSFIQQLAGNRYRINANSPLYELEGILGITFPEENFDTLSDFLIDQLGYTPANHEKPNLLYKNVQFEITEHTSQQIQSAIATIYEEGVTYIDQFHKQPS
ncbi:transporter associated domain-containing protein [Oceanobacillus sp. 1P07AA]|uniref:transporter associated domain-containing protein n=1 Tax=Oceanobacillus sp. 1P07AA TaxID=3132293 RepID=UPI0039A4A003